MLSQSEGDDDVRFLYSTRASEAIKCPTCSLDLSDLTLVDRTSHCDSHFDDGPQAGPSLSSLFVDKARKPGTMFKPRPFHKLGSTPSEDSETFWRSSLATKPPANFTPGLIPVLKRILLKSHAKGNTQRAYLCSPLAVHIQSENWDRSWGCGYRNYLMACAPLMDQEEQPDYAKLLEAPDPPGVRRLQRLIERAWESGFDQEGARQLDRRVVGTKKWIGTAELYAVFAYKGIPSCLVDFVPRESGINVLIAWIVDYFSDDSLRPLNVNQALLGASPVVVTDRLPLILQHQGHSRTVVGFERSKDCSVNLIVFDPSRRIPSELREVALASHFGTNTNMVQNRNSHHRLSPSKLVNKVFHTERNDRKRGASEALAETGSAAKRVRAGNPDDIIVIDSDDDQEGDSGDMRNGPSAGPMSIVSNGDDLQWSKLTKLFRLTPKDLEKRDKYQILYFPLWDPLTDAQRQDRKIVKSLKIT